MNLNLSHIPIPGEPEFAVSIPIRDLMNLNLDLVPLLGEWIKFQSLLGI